MVWFLSLCSLLTPASVLQQTDVYGFIHGSGGDQWCYWMEGACCHIPAGGSQVHEWYPKWCSTESWMWKTCLKGVITPFVATSFPSTLFPSTQLSTCDLSPSLEMTFCGLPSFWTAVLGFLYNILIQIRFFFLLNSLLENALFTYTNNIIY